MSLVLRSLTTAADGPLSIEADAITADRLAGLADAEIARLELAADGRPCPLGELFSVAGSAADGRVECEGDWSRVHRLAAGMQGGEILVRGDVGRHAAARMAGGRLVVEGRAGDWLAAGISGGAVLVEGDAGDNVTAAVPGDDHGMTGGLVVVNGSVGCLAAARMRRGILGVGGSCGEAAAFELRAGTVVVGGQVGPRSGMGMRRGSLVALAGVPPVPPTFARGAAWSPNVLPLVVGRLSRAGFRPAGGPGAAMRGGVWQQWHGDLLTGGRGEIFHRSA
jgi:formylmethanofuran dehydrogenase subunit C